MKERYSIGETAKLFDVSVQTLRFYEKMGLFAPAYINQKTGYRYYSRDQFHYLDRIHYLKNLGLTLKEIKEILQSGDVDSLRSFLRKNLDERHREVRQLQEQISDLQWYLQYFDYLDSGRAEGQVYVNELEERYMLACPCLPDEPFKLIEDKLYQLRAREEFKELEYRRHYGFIIDFNDMLQQHFSPTAASIYLKRRPNIISPYLMTLPAGKYLCFEAKLRLDEWNAGEVRRFFAENNVKPVLVVANEYEDNLVEYTATPYEVQVYLAPV